MTTFPFRPLQLCARAHSLLFISWILVRLLALLIWIAGKTAFPPYHELLSTSAVATFPVAHTASPIAVAAIFLDGPPAFKCA